MNDVSLFRFRFVLSARKSSKGTNDAWKKKNERRKKKRTNIYQAFQENSKKFLHFCLNFDCQVSSYFIVNRSNLAGTLKDETFRKLIFHL